MNIDCCFCNKYVAEHYTYMRPGNTICCDCHNGGKEMITFLNEAHDSESTGTKVKGICRGLKRMREMEERMREMEEKVSFLEEKVSFLDAVDMLKEGLLTDIMVKPGNGPPISAHRALLAAKSRILRTMLISDDCKAAAQDSISFPELSHNELKCLLEFLYSGSLTVPLDNSSLYRLHIASDKYDIPFLQEQSRNRILVALEPFNALDALEVSQICSDVKLKEEVIGMIIDNAEDVVLSVGYEEFASKNPRLSVDIMRALLKRGM